MIYQRYHSTHIVLRQSISTLGTGVEGKSHRSLKCTHWRGCLSKNGCIPRSEMFLRTHNIHWYAPTERNWPIFQLTTSCNRSSVLHPSNFAESSTAYGVSSVVKYAHYTGQTINPIKLINPCVLCRGGSQIKVRLKLWQMTVAADCINLSLRSNPFKNVCNCLDGNRMRTHSVVSIFRGLLCTKLHVRHLTDRWLKDCDPVSLP